MQVTPMIPPDLADHDTVKVTVVAKWLKVTPHTVRAWADEGRLPRIIRLGPKVHRMNVGELRKAFAKLAPPVLETSTAGEAK